MSIREAVIFPSTFNRRISVKRAIAAIDSGGGVYNATYDTRFETFASVESMSTSRKIYLGLDAFDSAYDIVLRYASDRLFTTADLIDYIDGGNTVTLSVMSVQLVTQGYKKFNVLVAKQTDPQG